MIRMGGGESIPTTVRSSKTGKIAIKVIDHYGDEVLKVYCI